MSASTHRIALQHAAAAGTGAIDARSSFLAASRDAFSARRSIRLRYRHAGNIPGLARTII